MKYLVTGGCGFIGSNFIHMILEKHPKTSIINIDAMKVGSNSQNFNNFSNRNYTFVKGDICNKSLMKKLISKVDYVINFAAESHVDRSIAESASFLKSNVLGVHNILEIIRENKQIHFLQISTDEVYGESLKKNCLEHDELNPSNPYSATKAAAEMLIRAYVRTYGIKAKITRCTNNFGPRQYPEKLIPKTIISVMKNQKIPLHGKGLAKRQWIHVYDHCVALNKIILKWPKSMIFNISGNYETTNLDIVNRILVLMNKPKNLITFVPDRPGQDRGYRINSNLIKKELGFRPVMKPIPSLESTVKWYIDNKKWWQSIPFNRIKNPTPWK
jgi:dTDP-glucose 4,6-dehydratase